MMKSNSILTSTLSAFGIAAAIFCIMAVIFDILNQGSFHTENYSITKMAALLRQAQEARSADESENYRNQSLTARRPANTCRPLGI